MNRLEQLNETLSQLRATLRQEERTRAAWTDLQEQVRQARARKRELSLALEKEEEDVRVLEGLSLQAILQTILGRKEELLEQEQREAVAARVHYQDACRILEDLTARLDQTAEKLRQAKGVHHRYATLLEEKKALLKQHSPALAGRIVSLEEELETHRSMVKELQEARQAGEGALSDLDQALESLDKAAGWGTYDMLGGGLIATSIKHDHLDQARTHTAAAEQSLSRFRTELADVKLHIHLDLSMDEVATFCDYFFDGFFADWMVQGRIKDAQSDVSEAQNQVRSVLSRLETMDTQTIQACDRLTRELTSLVESA